jgi:hypothetical protein
MKIKVKDDLFDISIKKQLHPGIWDEESLNFAVREKLLDIAKDFIDYLEILDPEDVEDVRLTGSLANYNYTSYSDLDLHVVVDFEKLLGNNKFIESFFKAKKTVWNNKHDILIKGFDVELYVEDDGEVHHATGIYSVTEDVWVKKPKILSAKIDKKAVIKKYEDLVDRFKHLVKKKAAEEDFRSFLKKIIDMRRGGLEKGGEYSIENLAFKLLRRFGIITKIVNTFDTMYDKKLSLDERKLLIEDEYY